MDNDRGGDPLLARLIGYGIAAVILCVLLLLPMAARAQAASAPAITPCLPGNALFKGTGTDYGVFETADVHGEVGWCQQPNGTWAIFVHRWCLRATNCGAPPDAWTRLAAAIDRVRAAASPASQIAAEWQSVSVHLTTDLQRWQVRSWWHQACQWLTSTQPGVTPRPPMPIAITPPPVNQDGSVWVPPLTYCDVLAPGPKPALPCAAQSATWTQGTAACDAAYAGGESGSSQALVDATGPSTGSATATCTDGTLAISSPLCSVPPPPAVVWEVTPNGTAATRPTYPAIQDGTGKWKRSVTAGGQAPVLSACDCQAIDIFEFNITHYCKVPIAPAPQVTACRKRK